MLSNAHLITQEGEILDKPIGQLILLTHEAEFYKWAYRKLNTPKSLRIVSGSRVSGVATSDIEDCDVQTDFIEAKNQVKLRKIKKIINDGSTIQHYGELCNDCRSIMESIFCRKYLFELEHEIAKRKSIRTFVERLTELQLNDFDIETKKKSFIALCDNLNIELHESEFTNADGNEASVLRDFLRLLKEI